MEIKDVLTTNINDVTPKHVYSTLKERIIGSQ